MSASELMVVGSVLLIPFLAILTLREKHILHAIIGRGMLGIAAAIAYALMGAPDVAVTEALMGALLVTLLYVVVFTSTGEFRVGYVELPPLVQRDKEKLEGYMVDLIRGFGHSAGLKPRFVFFDSRETLMEALNEGLMDMAIGPFVQPFDSGKEYLALPLVETKVYQTSDGEWLDVIRAKFRSGIPWTEQADTKVFQAFYSVLVSEDAHDLREMLSRFVEDEGKAGIPSLREKYLGERT